ncbi:MAG TPA: OmpA family protein [Bacteroidota bacterium]|nr:OmpA family protein [Bacteroidota bacterium]
MRLPTYRLILFLVLCGATSAFSQDVTNAVGFGAAFGTAIARTDITKPDNTMFTRAFFRYYATPHLSLEAGVGLGTLEADDGTNFFTSPIYPVDFRLVARPVAEGKIQPYGYAGIGLMYFNPKDHSNLALPRNAAGEYNHFTNCVPVGAGVEFPVSDQTLLGISGGYTMTTTPNLEDIKTNSKDGFWSVVISLFAFLKPQNPDLDGDGLLNDEEVKIGTDPLNPDTDGDGLKDGDEVHIYHTDPLKKDTDGDGLTDGEEVLKYHTDPLKKDTDGDGLSDGDEVMIYHTDPLKVDTDGDGLSDGDEVLKYHTDPLKVDTDGDGLSDGEEVLKYHTDPLKMDTDGDGLSDGDEVLKYHTDPLKMDTDGGGMPDGKEIQLGLNPLDPSDDVPIINVGERIILEGVNFETNRTTLLPSARGILDQVAASLDAYPSAEVAIYGHTDNVGGAKYNMKLSIGRADAVKAYLVTKGIDGRRITTKGFGFTKPVADNSTADGRAKNRRIEFVRLK